MGKKTQRKLSKKSTFKIMDYFEDDEKEREKRARMKEASYNANDHEINFSIKQYAEFFFYHVVYFLMIGPLIGFFLLCFPKARYLFYNMEFIRLNSIAFTQAFYWMISMFIIIGFCLQYFKMSSNVQVGGVFDAPLLKTIITSIILRTTSIAGKYATYTEDLVHRYKTEYIGKDVIFTEFMLVGWLKQGHDVIFTEICHCLTRLEIDKSTFALAFNAKVSQHCLDGLKGVMQERGEDPAKGLFLEYKQNQREFIYFKGDLVFEYMVKLFNQGLHIPLRMVIGWILGFAWAFVPSILRVVEGQSFHGEGWMEITATYLNELLSSFLFFVQYMFYVQAITDLSRKYFVMCQLGFMMSPRKIKMYSFKKYFPTIAILDTVSLNSWYNLRRMSLDFGRKYFYRHEIFLPVNLLLTFLNVIFYFVALYMVRLGTISQSKTTTKLMYTCIIDGCLFLFATFHFLDKAGKLNSEFDAHISLIQKNRSLISNMLQFRYFYFSKFIGSQNRFGRNFKEVLPQSSDSALHRKIKQDVLKMIGDQLRDSDDPDKFLQDFFNDIIKDYDKLCTELEHEKVFEQVRVLGITITRSSVLNFLVALVSAIFTVYQLLFPNDG